MAKYSRDIGGKEERHGAKKRDKWFIEMDGLVDSVAQ